MFVASHLQVSLLTFYEKCWCLDLSWCLDFCTITGTFFQNHHLSQQTWLRTIQFVYFFCSTSLLNCSSSVPMVVSSVELVKSLFSNLELMAYLVVLCFLLPDPPLTISKLLPKYSLFGNFRSSKMSSFSLLFLTLYLFKV